RRRSEAFESLPQIPNLQNKWKSPRRECGGTGMPFGNSAGEASRKPSPQLSCISWFEFPTSTEGRLPIANPDQQDQLKKEGERKIHPFRIVPWLRRAALLILAAILASGCSTAMDWLDRTARATGQPSAVALTQQQIVAGLKEALNHGVDHAVTSLGRDGGFLGDVRVRIPTPESLAPLERTLRAVGQDRLVDDFHNAMNRAAEQA